jgi:hypothetical protein
VISSDHLEPGASGQIQTSVETAGRSGRVEKHVSLYSNDPQSPVITLSISMDVVAK